MTYKNDRTPPARPDPGEDVPVAEAAQPAASARRLLRLVPREIAPNPSDPNTTETMREQCPAMLDRALQARIGAMLREVYADVAKAPVPDRFVALLKALPDEDKPRE